MIALIENRKFTDEQIAAWQVLLRNTSLLLQVNRLFIIINRILKP